MLDFIAGLIQTEIEWYFCCDVDVRPQQDIAPKF